MLPHSKVGFNPLEFKDSGLKPGDYREAFMEPRAKARGNSTITY